MMPITVFTYSINTSYKETGNTLAGTPYQSL